MKINNPNHLSYRNINCEQTQAIAINNGSQIQLGGYHMIGIFTSQSTSTKACFTFNLQFVVLVVIVIFIVIVVVIGIFVILCEPQQTFLGLALPLNFQFLGLA